MRELFRDGAWQGLTVDGVYPTLAPIPMVLAWLLAPPLSYLVAWILVVTAFDALGFAFLLGRGTARGRLVAAWFWLAFIVLIGPVALGRLEAVTVAIAVVGALLLSTRPAVAGVVLAIGTSIKIWPAALIAAALVGLRRRWSVVIGAAALTAAILLVGAVTGNLSHMLSFVSGQTGRGIQLEAPVALPLLFASAFGAPGIEVVFDTAISTYQLEGPGVDVLAAVMTPVLAVVVLALLLVGVRSQRRGSPEIHLVALLGLALVLALILFNKVGSPQFALWLVAPVVLGLSAEIRAFRLFALLALAVAATTQLVYPLLYDHLLALDGIGLAAQLLRVGSLTAVFVIVVVALWRLDGRTGATSEPPVTVQS